MNKQLLVIGAGTESLHAIETAKERGYKVIAFDGDSKASGLKRADISYVTDIRNPQNIVNQLKSKPDFILPVPIGRYLTSTGAINDILKLKGISELATKNCTDKFLFHQTLSNEQLRSNKCILITKGSLPNENLIPKGFFPFILKPRFGSGSKGVYRIDNQAYFNKLINSIFPSNEDYIAETLFNGTEYGADGFIFNGELYLLLIREKLLTPPPYCQCIGYLSLNRTDNINFYQTTTANLKKIAKTLSMDNCIFHCDFMGDDMHTDVIEISARPSGHNLHNIFTPLVTGVSMIDTYINFMENKPINIDSNRIKTMLIGYFDFDDCTISKAPSIEEIKDLLKENLISYECNLKEGYAEKITNGHSLMGRGFYILEGKNKNELLINREKLLKCFITH